MLAVALSSAQSSERLAREAADGAAARLQAMEMQRVQSHAAAERRHTATPAANSPAPVATPGPNASVALEERQRRADVLFIRQLEALEARRSRVTGPNDHALLQKMQDSIEGLRGAWDKVDSAASEQERLAAQAEAHARMGELVQASAASIREQLKHQLRNLGVTDPTQLDTAAASIERVYRENSFDWTNLMDRGR
jgi:hypothetical protein